MFLKCQSRLSSVSLLVLSVVVACVVFENSEAFVIPTTTRAAATTANSNTLSYPQRQKTTRFASLNNNNNNNNNDKDTTQQNKNQPFLSKIDISVRTILFSSLLTITSFLPMNTNVMMGGPLPAYASDSKAIVSCLFQKCQVQLGKCILNPKCLANVICINTCNGKEDETGCQIQCGDLFENEIVGEFNKCVVSDMKCVPQKQDEGEYPIPSADIVVSDFNTGKFFDNTKLYITAGQNKLFDIFPCQVHFFKETSPGKIYGKLNWRIEEPDGEFFTRDAIQQFVQDPKQAGHLINHNNEYLHYEDDWYIIDYEYENNEKGLPPFAFVYYRGNNDAWVGYGGVVIYTKAASLPEELLPRLRIAAEKVGYNFDTDFTITDNTCPAAMDAKDALLLREKFAGKVLLQTEQQIQAQATRFRGNAVNSVLAQKIFFEDETKEATNAFIELEKKAIEFEQEALANVGKSAIELEQKAVELEQKIIGAPATSGAIELEQEPSSNVEKSAIELEQKDIELEQKAIESEPATSGAIESEQETISNVDKSAIDLEQKAIESEQEIIGAPATSGAEQ